jgi:L-asparagine transporter-like permease
VQKRLIETQSRSFITSIFRPCHPEETEGMKFTGFCAIVLYFYIIFALAMMLTIAISHLRLRNKMEKENRQVLKMKMWLFPYLTYVTIFGIVVFLISMAFIDSMRSQLV